MAPSMIVGGWLWWCGSLLSIILLSFDWEEKMCGR